jgi:hypothetical protein
MANVFESSKKTLKGIYGREKVLCEKNTEIVYERLFSLFTMNIKINY